MRIILILCLLLTHMQSISGFCWFCLSKSSESVYSFSVWLPHSGSGIIISCLDNSLRFSSPFFTEATAIILKFKLDHAIPLLKMSCYP